MAVQADRQTEVISQRARVDALSHQRLATGLIAHLDALPLSSVISIQGSWGRGKTDVLARAYMELRTRAREVGSPEPLWLNPWQYGTPDLIRPVVLNLLARLQPNQRSSTLRRATKTLLRASNAMLFKALTVVAPFGEIIGAAEGSVDDFIKEIFEPQQNSGPVGQDADPVAAMAERFRELVDEYSTLKNYKTGRLIICVDDLDRCLPDHQIAMLEAIYFLTGAGANCSFLIALDPTLVQQAAVTHYKTAGFDSNQYLDKLFDLRINLPSLMNDSIQELIREELSRDIKIGDNRTTIASLLHDAWSVEIENAVHIFTELARFPELTNPRLIGRIVERLQLLARASLIAGDTRLGGDPNVFNAVVHWCVVAERWPQLRHTLQAIDPATWAPVLQTLMESYSGSRRSQNDIWDNIIVRMPNKDNNPDLGKFLELIQGSRYLDRLVLVDGVMVSLGL
jgi:hypothetical protein